METNNPPWTIFMSLDRQVRICSMNSPFAQYGQFIVQSFVKGEWMTICFSYYSLVDLAGSGYIRGE